jgi:RNA polymerase sigma-70 factor (ECF subfamily)
VPLNRKERCIAQARAGDRQAFAALVEHYWARVCRWLCALTRSAHTAEDLTQEAFLKAWAALNTFEPGTNFRAWLFRIAGNAFFDTQRGPRGVAPQALTPDHASKEPGPVQVALTKEIQVLLDAAIARLPVGFRAALLLRVQEGFSCREIAKALDLTEKTARWRVFKARQLLMEDLGLNLDGDAGGL